MTFMAACAPTVTASDPFYEQFCATDQVCAGAGTCVDAAVTYACVPRGCSVAVSCRAEIGPDSAACAFNTTIDGRTCAVHFAFSLDSAQHEVGVTAQLSNGSVSGAHLQNTWMAPGVEARLKVLGFDLGGAYAHAYRSDIQSDGHAWTEVGVAAGHHGGPGFGEDAVVAIELMDFRPEGCWLRSPTGALPDVSCPSMSNVYRLIPFP